MLDDRHAVIFGGGGIVGSAAARSLAHDGAAVHLAGRTAAPMDRVAREIVGRGARAEVTVVDATDEDAVSAYLDDVAGRAGGLDVLVNAVTHADVQGTPLLELPTSTMADALLTAVRAQTATIRAAARLMSGRGGVIVTVVGHGPPHPGMGTTAVTWQTIEALQRQWAVELGPLGIRVAWVRINGTVEAITSGPDRGSSYAGDTEPDRLLAEIAEGTMLRRLPAASEVGDAIAFLASDRGRSITAGALNLTAGAVSD